MGHLISSSQIISKPKIFKKKKDLSLDLGNNSSTGCVFCAILLRDFTLTQRVASKVSKTTNCIIHKSIKRIQIKMSAFE